MGDNQQDDKGGVLRQLPPMFFLAMAASATFFMSLQLVLPRLPAYAIDVGVNEAAWGFAVTVTASFAGSIRLLGGPFADQLGRKRVMIFGAAAMGLGGLALALTDSYGGLLLGRALQGMGLGTFTTAYKALIIDLAPPGKRATAIGIGNLTFAIALLTAPLFGDLIFLNVGYFPLFMASAAMGAVSVGLVLLLRVADQTERTRRTVIEGARTVLPMRTQQAGIVGMLGVAILFVAVFSFLTLLATDRGFLGVGVAFSMYAIAELTGQLLGGRLADAWGRRIVIMIGMGVGALGLVTLLLAGVLPVLVAGTAVVGVALGVSRVSIDTLVAEGAPNDLRATATGLQYASFDLWIGLSSWGLGILAAATSYDVLYTVMAAIPVVWIVVMAWLVPNRTTERAMAEAATDR